MMDESIYGLALLIAIVWPLVLAFPAVHKKLPACRQLALLPALLILIWPGGARLEMPELLMGVDLSLSTGTRWLLGMALLIWLVVARLESRDLGQAEPESAVPFYMLTLSGHLGAILANDMMGFSCFRP